MKCYRCNTEVADGASFCPNCGNSLKMPQQSQQGQYQQRSQQSPQQSQFQLHQGYYVKQKVQQPHNPQLSFVEAIQLASRRLTDFDGRSRRSEFWWWNLAVLLLAVILGLIPYLDAFSYLIQFGLLSAITIRRLNDVPAPEWFGKIYLGIYGATTIILLIFTLASTYRLEIAEALIWDWSTFSNLMAVFSILLFIGAIGMIYFCIKDSNPEIDPMHGPSPKYTL